MISYQECQSHPNYRKIPDLVLEGLIKYRDEGVVPGSFLQSVLANDLCGAVGRADQWSMAALKEIVMFVYNEMPAPCWGSDSAIDRNEKNMRQTA